MEYTVGTHENITPGVFHKLTGGLSSQGLQILSADINTLARGMVLDRFIVLDPDFAGEPTAGRIQEIEARLAAANQRCAARLPSHLAIGQAVRQATRWANCPRK